MFLKNNNNELYIRLLMCRDVSAEIHKSNCSLGSVNVTGY